MSIKLGSTLKSLEDFEIELKKLSEEHLTHFTISDSKL